MATVVLIRAGSTDYDDQHRLLGTLDMPVNQKGVDEAREVARRLQDQGLRLEAIYTSPEDPACSTAHLIAESQPAAKVKELEELRNVNQGLWQGLPESDVRKRFPKLFRNGKDSSLSICPPEGETLSDACQRLTRAISRAIRRHDIFAVVAPEPLATVIRCTLQHRQPRVTACLCGEEQKELVQIIEATTFDAAQLLSGNPPDAPECRNHDSASPAIVNSGEQETAG